VELDWLETFLAVVDRGGFTAASEHVHRSQSRVSAHIAGLERELGVRLIDRTRRPATVTAAGRVLARHAREIVAGVGSARSAVGALRALERESVAVVTTSCIGCALFPGVLAALLVEYPGASLTLSELTPSGLRSAEADAPVPVDGAAVAVLPTLAPPLASGLHEQVLWREPLRLVVDAGHEFARRRKPVRLDELVGHPLVLCGSTGEPELRARLHGLGLTARTRAVVDTPQSLIGTARAGAGVGVAGALALQHGDTGGVVLLDIDEEDLVREVAAYWYPVLPSTPVGAALLRTVLESPVPAGASAPPNRGT
jgi:DNA-binding transcriptional LysR family regulator